MTLFAGLKAQILNSSKFNAIIRQIIQLPYWNIHIPAQKIKMRKVRPHFHNWQKNKFHENLTEKVFFGLF
jgi:hypothetical protein